MFNFGELSMKKSLIALAALAATGAIAQSSVTLYGRVDMAVGTAQTKSADGTTVNQKSRGVVDGSHTSNAIGFRGTEDLGGGLRAGFVLEQGISPTQSNGFNLRAGSSDHQVGSAGAMTSGTNRASNLFLAGGFGELRVGTMNRLGYNVASKAIVVGENFGGEQHGLIMSTRQTGLQYTAPTMGNVTLSLQYGGAHGQRTDLNNVADSGDGFRRNKDEITALSVEYRSGPLYLGGAYEKRDVLKTANSAATTNAYGGTVAIGTAIAARSEDAYALAVQYDLGVARLNVTHNKRDDNHATASSAKKYSNTNLGVAIPMGALTVSFHVVDYQMKTGTTTTNDVSGSQLGATYALSKRTTAYAHYFSDKDKAVATTALSKRTRTNIGIAHSF
jgi:predicted porin